MPSLDKRVSAADPTQTRSAEDSRGAIAQHDYDAVVARIAQRTQGMTDPLHIQRVVDEEVARYEAQATQKNVLWTLDTMVRSQGRADRMLSMLKVQVMPSLGPRGINPQLRDALTVNVRNEISSVAALTRQKVTAALIEGVDEGAGPREIAKNIAEATGMERHRAELIARDQTLKANRAVTNDRYRRHGIQRIRWLTAQDDRACDECRDLDGQEFDIDDIPHVHGGTDIQCRCAQLPVVGEAEA